MLQIIQNNLNICPKTLSKLILSKITNGINLSDKELEYFKKYKIKGIAEFGLIKNGCWIESVYGDRQYYLNGLCHREDGPAIECSDGYKAYYINGKDVSKNN